MVNAYTIKRFGKAFLKGIEERKEASEEIKINNVTSQLVPEPHIKIDTVTKKDQTDKAIINNTKTNTQITSNVSHSGSDQMMNHEFGKH